MAWLHAVKKRKEAEFPTVPDYSKWLIDTLQNLGIAPKGEPLTFVELSAWMQVTQAELSPWEAELITHLSAFYLSKVTQYTPEEAAPPMESIESKTKRLARLDQAARDSW